MNIHKYSFFYVKYVLLFFEKSNNSGFNLIPLLVRDQFLAESILDSSALQQMMRNVECKWRISISNWDYVRFLEYSGLQEKLTLSWVKLGLSFRFLITTRTTCFSSGELCNQCKSIVFSKNNGQKQNRYCGNEIAEQIGRLHEKSGLMGLICTHPQYTVKNNSYPILLNWWQILIVGSLKTVTNSVHAENNRQKSNDLHTVKLKCKVNYYSVKSWLNSSKIFYN